MAGLRGHTRARQRFSATDQAVAILISHGAVIVVITLVMIIGVGAWPAWQFWVGELVILALCASIFLNADSFAEFFGRYSEPIQESLKKRFKCWREAMPPVIFGIAFMLQFAALAALLVQTGGPVDSPFAQLALAYAVFPPLLANETRTVWVALTLSILFYCGMILGYGGEAHLNRPGPWVFFAVSVLIVTATVGLTMLDRWDSERQRMGPSEKQLSSDGRQRTAI